MSYYGYIVSSLNKDLLFVFGNHNLKEISNYRREYRKIQGFRHPLGEIHNTYGSTYICDRVVEKQGIIIAGLGGSYVYNKGKNQYSELQMFLKILRLFPFLLFNRIFKGRWLDILVTHAPVRGVNDGTDRCHRGFTVFRWFHRIFKPEYHLHGHIHLYDLNTERKSRFLGTTVINVYNSYILEVNSAYDKQYLHKSEG